MDTSLFGKTEDIEEPTENCMTLQLARNDFQGLKASICLLAAPSSELPLNHLTGEELGHLGKIDVPKRRQEFIQGRHAAKIAASRFLGISELTSLEISSGVFSQPILKESSVPTGLEMPDVSISHSGNIAVAVAFPSSHPMGIDFQTADPKHINSLRDESSDSEAKLLDRFLWDDVLKWTLIWTIKESLSKTLKTGLMSPFSIFEIQNMSSHPGELGVDQLLKSQGIDPLAGSPVVSTFKNFAQYQALSWVSTKGILSLALPKHTRINGI
jgi:4'-phosphopantetheinyl transferase